MKNKLARYMYFTAGDMHALLPAVVPVMSIKKLELVALMSTLNETIILKRRRRRRRRKKDNKKSIQEISGNNIR